MNSSVKTTYCGKQSGMRQGLVIKLLVAALLIFAPSAYAQNSPVASTVSPAKQTIGHIEIKGNQRVEDSTIRTYLNLNEGGEFNQYDIDTALKNLYATGFFADANITPGATQGNRVNLVVDVLENPVINKLAFEGNKAIEDKDLQPELELKPRAIYTRTKLQADVKRILDIYRRGGRYSAQVVPKVISLDQNRIDLVYEIQEGPVAKVEKISFIGNENFDSKTLSKAVATSETRWYKFLSSDDKYDPERLQYDQELLRRFYTSEGFADFQVKSAIAELSPGKDAFYITFTIEEGKKYTFGTVAVNSALKGVDPAALKEKVTTVAGETYNGSKIESSIDAMTKQLGDQGFAFIDINPKLDRDTEKQTISLAYNIKEGPRVYVQRINITGNVRTLDEVIRREFRIAEGDPYSTSKIARTEQRLNNLGYFEKVKITNVPGETPDKTVINVDVQEKSTGEITIGGGFSTTDGPIAEAGIREKNFLGRGQDISLNATLSGIRQMYDLSFTEPYFLGRELAAGADLFKTELLTDTGILYNMDTNGGRLRLSYALNEQWQHGLNYTIKQTTVGDVQAGASIFILDQQGTTVESSVGQSLTYEGRDNKINPTHGLFFRLNQDVAGVGGTTDYIRNEVHTGYYYPIAPKWTFSLSGAGGNIFGLGQSVGIQDRFFLGGQTFRGFENYGVGPHDKMTGDSLGGNSYFVVTPQMTFPLGLPEDLGFLGEVFVDAGSLWDVQESAAEISAAGEQVEDNKMLRVSVGVGVLWTSPFGPIHIDLADAILKDSYDHTQIFQFNFGTKF
jgi:outer membrane protein insertion porin family